MIIHKPTEGLDERHSKDVILLLREYVDWKGIEQDPEMFFMRRPRTCISSSTKADAVVLSDQVFHVSRDHGIQEMEKQESREERCPSEQLTTVVSGW